MKRRCQSSSPKRSDTACNLLKPLSDFFTSKITRDGFDNLCKPCRNKVKSRHADKPHIREARRIYGMQPHLVKKRKIYSQTHKEQRNIYEKKKRDSDPIYKLKLSIRTRTYNFLTRREISKNQKIEKLIGCTWFELATHLEKQFTPDMTWDNHELTGWHVDHIIPLSTLKDKDLKNKKKVFALFHFSNLRPLWYDENIRRTPKHPKY
jgi:hypothetical protein